MAAIVKVYSTVASKLNQLQVVDGQLIFVKDIKKIFLDMNGIRLGYDPIQVFSTEEERQGVLAPVEGFYFVESTGVMWRFSNEWKQLTPSNLDPLFFGNKKEDFPSQGNSATLYVADNATYKWDSLLKEYIMISNKTEWEKLGEK